MSNNKRCRLLCGCYSVKLTPMVQDKKPNMCKCSLYLKFQTLNSLLQAAVATSLYGVSHLCMCANFLGCCGVSD